MSSTATIDGLKSCALQDETLKCSLDKLPSLAGASFLPLMFCGTTAHVSDFPRLWLLRASEDLIHILPVTEYTLIQGISFAVCVEKDRSKGSGWKWPAGPLQKRFTLRMLWMNVSVGWGFLNIILKGAWASKIIFFLQVWSWKEISRQWHGSTHSKLFHYTYHLEDGHITYDTHEENRNLYFPRHQVLVFGIVVISTHFENLGSKKVTIRKLAKNRYSPNN